MESIQYILGGLLYLLSPAYRKKKRQQWEDQSSMVKIFDIGMWLTIGFIVVLTVIAVTVL